MDPKEIFNVDVALKSLIELVEASLLKASEDGEVSCNLFAGL